MSTKTVLGRGLLAAFVVVAASVPAHAVLLTVDLRTNYRPYDDFFRVDTLVVHPAPIPPLARWRSDLTGTNFVSGERVAEFDVASNSTHRVRVTVVDRDRAIVASREILVSIGSSTTSITVLMSRPAGRSKTVNLIDDRDRSRSVSPGDILRYTVETGGGTRFTDTPGPGSSLVAGSVTTTVGTVTRGNAPGDTSIVVTNPGTVRFDVEVQPIVSNQGRIFDGANMRLTDDPSTSAANDPTTVAVTCAR